MAEPRENENGNGPSLDDAGVDAAQSLEWAAWRKSQGPSETRIRDTENRRENLKEKTRASRKPKGGKPKETYRKNQRALRQTESELRGLKRQDAVSADARALAPWATFGSGAFDTMSGVGTLYDLATGERPEGAYGPLYAAGQALEGGGALMGGLHNMGESADALVPLIKNAKGQGAMAKLLSPLIKGTKVADEAMDPLMKSLKAVPGLKRLSSIADVVKGTGEVFEGLAGDGDGMDYSKLAHGGLDIAMGLGKTALAPVAALWDTAEGVNETATALVSEKKGAAYWSEVLKGAGQTGMGVAGLVAATSVADAGASLAPAAAIAIGSALTYGAGALLGLFADDEEKAPEKKPEKRADLYPPTVFDGAPGAFANRGTRISVASDAVQIHAAQAAPLDSGECESVMTQMFSSLSQSVA